MEFLLISSNLDTFKNGITPSTYKGLKTAMHDKHILKASHLSPQLILAVAGYNGEVDLHTPGSDYALGTAFKLRHEIDIALIATGAVHYPTAATFASSTEPLTFQDMCNIINLLHTLLMKGCNA